MSFICVTEKSKSSDERLEGREYPPISVDLGGKKNTLEGIYNDAGITIEVDKNETDIPDLKGPNSSYTRAELDGLMTQYKNNLAEGKICLLG